MKPNSLILPLLLCNVLTLAPLSIPTFAEAGDRTSAPASDETDGSAQFQAARRYLLGQGVKEDRAMALELMKAAAEKGYPDAVGGVGYFYSTGTGGVENDDIEAARWFRKGAELGSPKAMLNLGKLIQGGRVEARNENGLDWIRKAAEAGLHEAMQELGEHYYFGLGIPKDYNLALRWLLKAAEAGMVEPQNTVGVMFRDGLGTEIDIETAEIWFTKAAHSGNIRARSNLGHLINPANSNESRRIEALKWLILAAGQQEITAAKTLQEVLPNVPEADVEKAQSQADAMRAKPAPRKI